MGSPRSSFSPVALADPPVTAAAEARAFLGVERSVTGRRWADRLTSATGAQATAIAQTLGVTDTLARVLAGRGVAVGDAAAFLDPTVRALMPDPSRLTDMDAAAARIAAAVRAGERVAIFGDYDVDGATSSALLARFLRAVGLDPEIYIPDRLFEGYGPNVEAVRALARRGATLMVAVDCGTSSPDALAEAARLGVGVVVIDHHQTGADLPPALAIVNPNRPDDISGLGHLAAVGLVFMTVVAVNRVLRAGGFYATHAEPDLLAWLDLVALGTVCDVVPLRGLNRAFVAKGLLALRQGGNPGLTALAAAARLDGPAATHHLGFLLGPRINAGGRIGDAGLGARLLAGDDSVESERIAAELDRLNGERQAIEAVMLGEAVAAAEAEMAAGGDVPALFACGEGWHPGVVGLIASRLKDRFGRPAFAIAPQASGDGSGSARSIPGVDIGRVVRAAAAAGVLRKGGGHAMAAGFTVDLARLGEFRAFVAAETEIAVRKALAAARVLTIDAAVTARGASLDLIAELERAGPFGSGQPEPVVALPAHRIAYAEMVGDAHVRVTLSAGDGAGLKAMAFRAVGEPLGKALLESRDRPLHVAGTMSVDHWRGRSTPVLRILDVAAPGS